VRSLLAGCLVIVISFLAAACGQGTKREAGEPELPFRPIHSTFSPLPIGYRLETVLEGLASPTSIAATPDGRLLIAEQTTGRVRVVRWLLLM